MTAVVTKTYSFQDVQVTFFAPSASFAIAGNGVADEGVRITALGEKDAMTIGADGVGMHSLIASNAARVEIALLKESPINSLLTRVYNWQKVTSANWGNIIIVIENPVTGDKMSLTGGAFAKRADVAYASQGANLVWSFNFVDLDGFIG